MELTDDIIDMTYKFAWTFLKRGGRRDIDHNDLAHDALVKIAKAAPVPAEHLRHKVWLEIQTAFRDFYTNTTTRKHKTTRRVFKYGNLFLTSDINYFVCITTTFKLFSYSIPAIG